MIVKNLETNNVYYSPNTTLNDLCAVVGIVLFPRLTYPTFNTRYDVFRRDRKGKLERWLGNVTLSQAWVDITAEYNFQPLETI